MAAVPVDTPWFPSCMFFVVGVIFSGISGCTSLPKSRNAILVAERVLGFGICDGLLGIRPSIQS